MIDRSDFALRRDIHIGVTTDEQPDFNGPTGHRADWQNESTTIRLLSRAALFSGASRERQIRWVEARDTVDEWQLDDTADFVRGPSGLGGRSKEDLAPSGPSLTVQDERHLVTSCVTPAQAAGELLLALAYFKRFVCQTRDMKSHLRAHLRNETVSTVCCSTRAGIYLPPYPNRHNCISQDRCA